jgi:hypothetical protein
MAVGKGACGTEYVDPNGHAEPVTVLIKVVPSTMETGRVCVPQTETPINPYGRLTVAINPGPVDIDELRSEDSEDI